MKSLVSLIVSAVVVSSLAASFSARGASGDEHWDVQFGWPGSGLNSDSIATHNGQLYVSGAGSSLTNVPLELWDGTQWSVLAQFYGPSSGTIVYDLAFVGNTLYAAGTFTNVNGIAAGGLAKWDGANWSSVNNFNGTVAGLAVDSGNLYVSGIFTNPAVGGVIASNIAYWDGSAWHALGNGLGAGTTSSSVHQTAINNGLVYAVGSFTNSGPQFITNVAVWNGTSWSGLAGGGVNSVATSLVFSGNNLYVGGAFSQAGSTPASLAARWDGTNWYALAGLTGTEVLSLTTFNGSLYAGGLFTISGAVHGTNLAVWNGSTWAPLGSGITAGANATRVYATPTNVFVGGTFFLAGGLIANEFASWDGANWATIGAPGRLNGAASSVRAFAGQSTNLFVGGLFSTIGQLTNGSLIAHFDGANWSPMSNGLSGATGASVNAIDISNNVVYAGGSFTFAGNLSTPNVAQWDGTNWSALGSGPGGVVASLTVRTDGVYAAGAPQSGSTFGSPFFVRWDGSSWQSVLNFNSADTFFDEYITDPNIGMDAVAFQDTNIYVGGHFVIVWHDPSLTIETNCNNILRFDGTYARIVGTGLNSNVIAMTTLGTNLYVAGLFTNAGGVTASHIAMWDGNVWWPVGGGVVGNGTVDTLTTVGGNLYAGGTFTNMGGVPCSRIAKWDGNTWSALGSGVSATVLGLYSSGSNVYAGGSFKVAGDFQSQFLGLWNNQISFKTAAISNAAWLGNGQFQGRVFSVSGTTNVIEGSTDFNSWTPVLTNWVGNYNFVDTSAGAFPWRFYRARLVP